MNKAVTTGALVAVVALVGGLAYWAGTRSASAPVAAAPAKGPAGSPPPGIAVEASRVVSLSLPQALTAVGSLRSDETVIMRPEIAGRVATIHFREGERVAKGDVLVKLDDSVQRADSDRARANLTLSKSKFERAEDLRTKGFISSQAKDEAENNFRVAQSDAELTEAKLQKMTIKAPFSGTVGLRMVSVGDYVKEGQDIVNLEALDPLKVDFRVPEVFHTQVKDRQSLQITLDALPDKAYDGQVFAINPLIDANGRSIVIRAQVPNKDGRLRPGMFARVRLFTSESKPTLVVPEESLFPIGDEKFVYKVVDSKALRQKVTIGARREGRVEIVEGLTPEDVVVTAGGLKLREGVAVRVANTPSPATPVGRNETPPPNKS
jgi:membrane fusion protein (multidrug efflux system)